ncbi:hypothetical protein HW130_34245 [Streptomyces sp. PKU-EA00015]|uniref:hypothetical protein n=1 Tax=Streptomyces sp. PKU-EA00015 TaxID=2748326 RepID=UPI0015A1B169|nr:hypothetical protein [Streptomyces sp. PKU-EA00015]NWF31231.1 hypothetical protein [Streptomyces sp. PKU-EA00015]
MTTDAPQVRDRTRRLRTIGLTGALLLAGMAALLWLGADAVASRECFDTGYGLGDSISMTAEGCEVTVRTAEGERSAVLPTVSEGLAGAAVITALTAAVPPYVCLWLATRR